MRKNILLTVFAVLSIIGFGQNARIGDILCVQGADTIIVHPENYNGGGIGVVFYVDETGHHGWVLHPDIQAQQIQWSYVNELPWGLTGWNSQREAIYDLDGYDNTEFLRLASQNDHSKYPGAWAVDFEHGWYWPSIGQLNILYGSAPIINNSLKLLEGAQIQGKWFYWSSSVYGFDNDCALYLGSDGRLGAIVKSRTDLGDIPMSIRSIRNF